MSVKSLCMTWKKFINKLFSIQKSQKKKAVNSGNYCNSVVIFCNSQVNKYLLCCTLLFSAFQVLLQVM